MIIMQVVNVRLRPDSAERLSKRDYDHAQAWLTSWTPQNNIQAVICDSRTQAHETLQCDLQRLLSIPGSRLRGHHCQYQLAQQSVRVGRFWLFPGSTGGTWYDIPEEEQ